MRNQFARKVFVTGILSLLSFFSLKTAAQPASLESVLTSNDLIEKYKLDRIEALRAFYSMHHYQQVWLCVENLPARQSMSQLVMTCRERALDPCEYGDAVEGDESACSIPLEREDSVIAELKWCNAALRFFQDLWKGNEEPTFSYQGWPAKHSVDRIPVELSAALAQNKLVELADRYDQRDESLPVLLQMNCRLQAGTGQDGMISSVSVSSSNAILCRKLHLLGLTDTIITAGPDSIVRKKLRDAQRMFDLFESGTLSASTMECLNVPIAKRLSELRQAINYHRWLISLQRSGNMVVVTLPSASLVVLDTSGASVLDMKLVVGKPSTPTPTLTSQITDVMLYPYWVVPSSIISKEWLPAVRRDPSYIDRNNYQVLDRNGKLLDGRKISWNSVSASAFPYIVRQSTGCDNALGVIKLIFYNPFTVYLHDTPSKSLFMLEKRFFSHGCMRMEKPLEMVDLLLGERSADADSLIALGCLKNQAPVTLSLDNKVPVIVWYNRVSAGTDKKLVFYPDIYKKK